MKRLIFAATLLSFVVLTTHSQDGALGVLTKDGYINPALGFRYMPPSSLPLDQTYVERESLQKRAAELHRTTSTAILLRLVSGSADTSPDWASLGVTTFDRASWPDVDDFHAKTRMNVQTARGARPIGDDKSVTFSNVMFVASQFEMHEGSLTKHAIVYTTVRRGKLLTFAFSGNSADVVNEIAASMKSLAFSSPN